MRDLQKIKNKIQEFRNENKRISSITRDSKVFLLDHLYESIRNYIIDEFDFDAIEYIDNCLVIEPKEIMENILIEHRGIFKEGIEFVWDYLKDMDCRADFFYQDDYGNFYNLDDGIINDYLDSFEEYIEESLNI